MVQLYKPKRYCSYRWKIFLTTFLAITTLLGTAAAQNLTVKGKVIDGSTNEGLPGVSIGIKGTTSGTATDENGEFTLSAPADAVLVISFIGFKTEEVAVNNQNFVSVTLQVNEETLSEVVVVGYGTIEKKDATGALANVGTKDFNRGLIVGPEQLIVGKVAGLQVTPSGDPGGRADIRLRGVSLNGEYPLIVVDGVVLAEGGGGVTGVRNPLGFINPNDIATMSVLKDAQATAIYGARGANGVIIITTKSGVTGKPKFSYDGLYSTSIFTRRPDVFEASEFRQLVSVKEPGFVDDLGTSNTNWLDEVSRVAQSTQHNVSVSGGSNKTTYFASLNYLGSQGVLNESSHQRVNLSLRIDQKLLNDNLQLTLNTKNGFTKDNLGPNVIGAASAYDPTRPVYDEANELTGGYYQWANTIATGNPVASQNQQSTIGNSYRNVTSLLVRYELPFVKGLSFNANFAYDLNDGTNKYTQDTLARGNVNGDVKSVYSEKRVNNLYEYYGNYHATFGKHTVDVTAGYAWQNFRSDFSQDSYSDENPTNQDPVVNTPYVENRLISFFGRGTYDYAGKYLLTFSIRRDGSTRFGPDSRWGMFPAIGAGWRILEEGFANGLTNVFSELKIRGSYGVTGNEQIGNYQYSSYYRPSLPGASYQFGTDYVNTLTPNGADQALKWEENEQINAGIDAGILGGRVTFSLDFYQRTVNDLLFTISPPAGSIPDDQVLTNIGSVRNKGVEFISTIVAYDRENSNGRWALTPLITTMKLFN
jgi:TonB-linked SusC/RagA family outer membrane protein